MNPTMIASLPMYDFPEVRRYTDRWWQILAASFEQHGFSDVPKTLDRQQTNKAVWQNHNLFLTQTCGYPLRFEFREYLRPVSTPVYRAPGCDEGNYASAIVVRDSCTATELAELSGSVLAANSPDSQSGFNAIRDLVLDVEPRDQTRRFFRSVQWTGAHRTSLAALREKTADVAAIDPVSLALVRKHASNEFDGLKVIQFTRSVRGLPYAVPLNFTDDKVDRLRDALHAALEHADFEDVRENLLIAGFVDADVSDYDTIVQMSDRAAGESDLIEP